MTVTRRRRRHQKPRSCRGFGVMRWAPGRSQDLSLRAPVEQLDTNRLPIRVGTVACEPHRGEPAGPRASRSSSSSGATAHRRPAAASSTGARGTRCAPRARPSCSPRRSAPAATSRKERPRAAVVELDRARRPRLAGRGRGAGWERRASGPSLLRGMSTAGSPSLGVGCSSVARRTVCGGACGCAHAGECRRIGTAGAIRRQKTACASRANHSARRRGRTRLFSTGRVAESEIGPCADFVSIDR